MVVAWNSPGCRCPSCNPTRGPMKGRTRRAKFWELRTAVSYARFWRDQGKPIAARDLLSRVYGWFTEGFDTQDLQKAKALLDELGGDEPK